MHLQKDLNEIFTDFVTVTAFLHKQACSSDTSLKKKKKQKLIQTPWITKGILVLIRHKQKLFTSHYYLHRSASEKRFNKTYAKNQLKLKDFKKNCNFDRKVLIQDTTTKTVGAS